MIFSPLSSLTSANSIVSITIAELAGLIILKVYLSHIFFIIGLISKKSFAE